MHPMSTEDFLREIVFGNKGNASSSGSLLSGASGPMPPQAAGWQGTAPRQLAPNDTVDKVFPSKTIENNKAYFMHEGKVATKRQTEQKVKDFVNSFMDKARIVMERNEKK